MGIGGCSQSAEKMALKPKRVILAELDPEGSAYRQQRRLQRRQYFSKGPNYIWHIDSYDKLKTFGVCINGCIDGFSCLQNQQWPQIYWELFCRSFRNTKQLSQTCAHWPWHRKLPCTRATETFTQKPWRRFVRRAKLPHWSEYSKPTHWELVWHPPERGYGILDPASWGNMEIWDEGEFDGGVLDKAILQLCVMEIIQVWWLGVTVFLSGFGTFLESSLTFLKQ